MKQIVISVLIIALAVSLMTFAFTFNQVSQERERLLADLYSRSTLVADTIRESVEPVAITPDTQGLPQLMEKWVKRERLFGIVIVDSAGTPIAVSTGVPSEVSLSRAIATNAMDQDKANGAIVTLSGKNVYLLAVPLHTENSISGALMVIENAEYVDSRLKEIWQTTIVRLFLLIFLITVSVLMIIRWLIMEPVKSLSASLRSARTGRSITFDKITNSFLFRSLTKEITNIHRSLTEARLAAREEARVNLEKMDSPWTSERLKEFVKTLIKDRTIVVVSNREPYIHTKEKNEIKYYFPASGMATAVEPIMQACGGTWVAHGSGDADKMVVDAHDRVMVPPDEPKYTLRRVWLTPKEEQGFYYGFSNEGLWALCHTAHNRPIFRKEDWDQYQKVNQLFADAVLSEVKHLKKPIILIQDFHFALLPRLIKKARPDATIALFWHIPWVSAEAFSICPWKKELLDGMLGSDLLGFHTQLHCNNFIESVGHELESRIDFEQFSVTRDEHTSYIKPFPISIAFSSERDNPAAEEERLAEREKLLTKLNVQSKFIGVGVDRLDYTKGILERLKAVEIFLNTYHEYRQRFTFIQISAPSREKIKKYQEFADEVEKEVERINKLFQSKDWKPIVFLKRFHTHEEVNAYYRIANVCMVTSLHDGMNLVAKEFVAARSDQQGVLILSQFTGASRDLKQALIVNPYNGEQTSEAIKQALEMPLDEQKSRMRKLREQVRGYNVYRWSAELLRMIRVLE